MGTVLLAEKPNAGAKPLLLCTRAGVFFSMFFTKGRWHQERGAIPQLCRDSVSTTFVVKDRLFDLQSKPDPKRIENALRATGRDSLVFVLLVP